MRQAVLSIFSSFWFGWVSRHLLPFFFILVADRGLCSPS